MLPFFVGTHILAALSVLQSTMQRLLVVLHLHPAPATITWLQMHFLLLQHNKDTSATVHLHFKCQNHTLTPRFLSEQQDLQWKPSSELEALSSRELSQDGAALQSMSSQQIKFMRQQSLVPLYIAGEAMTKVQPLHCWPSCRCSCCWSGA